MGPSPKRAVHPTLWLNPASLRLEAAPVRESDVTGVKGSSSQALGRWTGAFTLSWSIGSMLILASWKKAFSSMGKGMGVGGPTGQGKDQLSPAAPTPCARSKNTVLSGPE